MSSADEVRLGHMLEAAREAIFFAKGRSRGDLDVIGMRNRLIHAYFDVDPDIIWDTVTQDLPLLVGALEDLIGSGS